MSEGTNHPQSKHILAAVGAVMEKVTNVPKGGEMTNRKGEHQYFFVRSADLVSKVGAEFREQSVMVQSRDLEVTLHQAPVSGANGSTMWTTSSVKIVYRFTSLVDGSEVEFASAGEGRDSSDKATAKAMTMAFKSALSQAFAIATDEKDPDAERPESMQQHRYAPPPPDTRTPQQREAEERYRQRKAQQEGGGQAGQPQRRQGSPATTPEQRDARRAAEVPEQADRRQQAAQNQPADPDPMGSATQALTDGLGARPVQDDSPVARATSVLEKATRDAVQAEMRGEVRRPRTSAENQRAQDCLRASAATSDRAQQVKIILAAQGEGLLTLTMGDSTVASQLAANLAVSS